jgi:hypothetical protein
MALWNKEYNCYTVSYGRLESSWSHVYELPAIEGSYEIQTVRNGIIVFKINAAAAEQIPEKLLVIVNSDYFENHFCHQLGGRVTSAQSSPVLLFYPPIKFEDGAKLEVLTICSFIQMSDEELSSKVSLATVNSDFQLKVNDKVVTYPEADGRKWNRLDASCNKVTVETGDDAQRYFKIVLEELPTCCFVSSYFYRMMYFH